ncbi:helix-turn-helix transcriptional regulator [Fundidesulfovibrio putealis]|uniref:helix-turn-helix transcriptional regulator n=1 Tax=Fundidesulfovibrio putealis TaxID=270496 RepID=UPI000687BF1F|nr:helix-turn-helix domain-containing protein [Fundidesulfovibrio putealis]
MDINQDHLQGVIELTLARLLAPVAELESLKRKEFLTEEEAAKLFSLSAATLKTKRCRGGGPSYIKDGGRVLYSRKGLEAYLEARRVKTIDQP